MAHGEIRRIPGMESRARVSEKTIALGIPLNRGRVGQPTPFLRYKQSVAPHSLIYPETLRGRNLPLRITGLYKLPPLDSFVASCQSESDREERR